MITEFEIEEMLNQQIYSNSMLTKRLSEKDKVIHSLAHDLVLASEYIEDWGTYVDPYFKEKHDLKGDVKKFKDIALSALNSITDKGEKK